MALPMRPDCGEACPGPDVLEVGGDAVGVLGAARHGSAFAACAAAAAAFVWGKVGNHVTVTIAGSPDAPSAMRSSSSAAPRSRDGCDMWSQWTL